MSEDDRSEDAASVEGEGEVNPVVRSFGKVLRLLRKARAWSQETMANRCGVSEDTVRRIESGKGMPNLVTLVRLAQGLNLATSTLFQVLELGERDEARELLDLIATRSPAEQAAAYRVLCGLFDEFDRLGAAVRALDLADETDQEGTGIEQEG